MHGQTTSGSKRCPANIVVDFRIVVAPKSSRLRPLARHHPGSMRYNRLVHQTNIVLPGRPGTSKPKRCVALAPVLQSPPGPLVACWRFLDGCAGTQLHKSRVRSTRKNRCGFTHSGQHAYDAMRAQDFNRTVRRATFAASVQPVSTAWANTLHKAVRQEHPIGAVPLADRPQREAWTVLNV